MVDFFTCVIYDPSDVAFCQMTLALVSTVPVRALVFVIQLFGNSAANVQ